MDGPDAVSQNIQRVVMAADDNNGVVNSRQGAQQFGRHGLVNFETLEMVGYPHDTIGLGKGGDAARPSGQRRCHNLVVDGPQLYPNKFFNTKLGCDFSCEFNLNQGPLLFGLP